MCLLGVRVGSVRKQMRDSHSIFCAKISTAMLQFRRFVMEDRFSAIRVAIGTAQAKDTVVIAGKGAEDFQEYGDLETGDLVRVRRCQMQVFVMR